MTAPVLKSATFTTPITAGCARLKRRKARISVLSCRWQVMRMSMTTAFWKHRMSRLSTVLQPERLNTFRRWTKINITLHRCPLQCRATARLRRNKLHVAIRETTRRAVPKKYSIWTCRPNRLFPCPLRSFLSLSTMTQTVRSWVQTCSGRVYRSYSPNRLVSVPVWKASVRMIRGC